MYEKKMILNFGAINSFEILFLSPKIYTKFLLEIQMK